MLPPPAMRWTPEQLEILGHPLGAHALVHAAPGAGKTTTLVGRVERLLDQEVDPRRVRVVMFNKAIQETFVARLAAADITGVTVTTFDALGLEVLRAAERRGLLSAPLEVAAHRTDEWARQVHRQHVRVIESADDIAAAVYFWKAHLVPPKKAACAHLPALVEAYRAVEALRGYKIDFPDMVYTAVAVLRRYPRLLGPIDHLLVDEFQDINPGRVELLRGLMHEGTAIMAVGDADQAIYEWAGAHPRFFREFAATFAALPTRHYPLSCSFRFGPEIAGAAARLIAHNEDRAPLEVVGGGATPGRVERVDDVGATIRGLLEHGHAPGDIAVLYRGRAQAVAVVAELAAGKIPMHTEDVDLLRRGRGPELALAYLGFATSHAPVDFDAAWAVVYAPDRYIRKDAFKAQIARVGGKGLQAALRGAKLARSLEQSRGGVESMATLADLLQRMGRCRTAGEALTLLVREVDIPAQLEGRQRNPAEQELAVAAFAAVHVILAGLGVAPAEAAQALADFDPRRGEPSEDCVWVSTIHRAKGKEWRCVLLPRLVEGMCPAEDRGERLGTVDAPEGIDQSDALEQERRIFYVGLTRAIEAVYLECPPVGASRFVAEQAPPRPARPRRRRGPRGRRARPTGPPRAGAPGCPTTTSAWPPAGPRARASRRWRCGSGARRPRSRPAWSASEWSAAGPRRAAKPENFSY